MMNYINNSSKKHKNNHPLPLGGPPSSQDKYNNYTKISVMFEEIPNKTNQETTQKIIEFPLTGRIFDLIERYRHEINDNNTNKLFLFNNKRLNLSESLIEAHLHNGCKITVINMNNK